MNFSAYTMLYGATGYDYVARGFLRAWHRNCHNIQAIDFVNWSHTRAYTDMDETLKKMQETQIPDPEFHINFSLMDQSQLNLGTPNFIYTMFETDRICGLWVEHSKKLDAIFVPTEWNKKTFIASGIPENKIFVIPPPLEINKIVDSPCTLSLREYSNKEISSYKHRFLNCSEYINRKNIECLLRAWCDETKQTDDACLILKLNSNSGLKLDFLKQKIDGIVKNKKCAPIFLYMHFMTEEAMLSLYKTCTHYISTSYGEGWGMSESICGVLGKKVIAPNSTAFTDYLTKENSYPIMVQGVAASQDGATGKYYAGSKWYAPIQYSVRKNIRTSINDANNNDRTKELLLSSELKEKCDADKVSNQMLEVIKAFKPHKDALPSKVEKPKDFNWMVACKTIGQRCGIADYSVNLYNGCMTEKNKEKFGGNLLIRGEAVEYRSVIDLNNLHLVNLQLEYQFITPRRLKLLLGYLNNSGIIPTVTLHTVNPRAYDYHETLLEANANVIVSSEPMKYLLAERCGFHNLDKIKVLPMGITTENVITPAPRNSPKLRIGFFGFCYFHKGIDRLVQYMNTYGDNKECLILSSKPANDQGYFDKMQSLVSSVKNGNVSWVSDYLKEDQIVEALSRCDVIFLPYSEYGGYATSAAIRTCIKAGVPIVAFDTSFFKDVVHDSALVEFVGKHTDSFDVWSSNLNKFLEQNAKNDIYKANYVLKRNEFIEKYNWEAVGAMHIDYFYGLVNKG